MNKPKSKRKKTRKMKPKKLKTGSENGNDDSDYENNSGTINSYYFRICKFFTVFCSFDFK